MIVNLCLAIASGCNLIDILMCFFKCRFDLGQGVTIISTDFTLQLEKWHHLEVIREGLRGTLIVDFVHSFTAVASGQWINLDLEQAKVYLGGATKILEDRM